MFLPLNDEPVHTFWHCFWGSCLSKFYFSILMYQIEVQGGFTLHVYIQGISQQSVKSNYALVRIYIWIFLNIRGPMCSWETHILAYLTSFYWNNVAHHLWSNLQTCKFFGGDKEFECTKCKASFKKNFQHFWPIYAFLVRMTVCTSHIKSFPWHQWPNWPQWPQQPQWPQWAHDPHFVKNL